MPTVTMTGALGFSGISLAGVLSHPYNNTQYIDYDSSTASDPVGPFIRSVRLVSSTDCHFIIFDSTNPASATVLDTFLPANKAEIFKIQYGQSIAAIKATGASAGRLYIMELEYFLDRKGFAEDANTLQGFNWASPGAIGSVAPNTGTFSTLSVTTNGSSSSPSLSVNGVGLYKGGSGVLGLSASSTVRGYLDSSGRNFTVEGDGATRMDERVISGVSANGAEVSAYQLWGRNSAASAFPYAQFLAKIVTNTAGAEEGQLNFETAVAGSVDARMTIKGNKVGIATTSPAKELDIVGDVQISAGKNYYSDSIALSNVLWRRVTVTAAAIASGGTVAVITGATGDTYRIREVFVVGGGTSFDAGGDRALALTDGTSTFLSITAVTMKVLPASCVRWGSSEAPLNSASFSQSVAAQNIRFVGSGGTTDYSSGSVIIDVCLEKTA